ncbi:MAG: ferrochelatase [Cycloclasticus sp. symbiont of Poecilosclerida sp. M]|nr:MAG: ferrochelatase [Cycloclasticus sp. symbiont of Poecilosclerida sp. M]
MTQPKTTVLLINLGTPEAPTEKAVRTFLKEFLWDPRVIEIPRFIWWFILNFAVLRTRPKISALAYQKVWTDEGSPLMVNSVRIQNKLQQYADQKADGKYLVSLAMRYGQPSIDTAVQALKSQDISNIIVLPLYPQFASSSTGTAWQSFRKSYATWRRAPASRTVMDYHDDDAYISALADSIKQHWSENGRAPCLVMSFHGVPERIIRQGDPYLEQCTKTADLLVEKLELEPLQWRLAFQSRFGKAKWIQPYCVDVLQELPSDNIKDVDVVCPGFAADCLETLEEIAMENREVFIQAGGEAYHYIPALNDNDAHISALYSLIDRHNIEEQNKLLESEKDEQ